MSIQKKALIGLISAAVIVGGLTRKFRQQPAHRDPSEDWSDYSEPVQTQ